MVPEHGLVTLSAQAWDEAKRRAHVIAPLAARAVVPIAAAETAAEQLGVSTRFVYKLIRRYRTSGSLLSALAPQPPTGGRGNTRLSQPVERVITQAIESVYLTRQKRRIEAVVFEVRRQCRMLGLQVPAANTVRARVRAVRPEIVLQLRAGTAAAQPLRAAPGSTPEASAPFEVFQIDHTLVDLIVVDAYQRLPIGRPYLTVAIDVFSRCIAGICLTLDPPSATSVGLCLTHAAMPKQAWLERLGVEVSWPIHGKPKRLYVDNAREFYSEALRKGCEQHGIALTYRPVARPHFGGIVERVLGTLMDLVHQLPGTTFSNIQARGTYDAEGMAALTVAELETWLALAIAGKYHQDIHATLLQSPLQRFATGLHEPPAPLRDPKAFLIDFLPLFRRRIQRRGFVLDHIAYFAPALRPWIAARQTTPPFLIRRDPRDLSRIWVLEPGMQFYIEVPYLTMQHPAITLWEHRQAMARLKEQGRATYDEHAIFRTVTAMRGLAETATHQTKATRRMHARRAGLPPAPAPHVAPPPAVDDASVPIQPFEVEEWS
jgi:putative transposase